MLNSSQRLSIKIHNSTDLNFLSQTKRLLFFFKFVKLKKFFQTNKDLWKDSLIFLNKHQNINVRQLLWGLKKNKKYKPYSFFKFNILRYRRIFNPRYWYDFNSYLLTRYNYLSFQGPTLDYRESSTRSVNLAVYESNSSYWSMRKAKDTLIWLQNANIFRNIILKKRRFLRKTTLFQEVSAKKWWSMKPVTKLLRFLAWWKYQRKLSFKNIRYRSIKYNQIPGRSYNKVSLKSNKTNQKSFLRVTKNIRFVNTQAGAKIVIVNKQKNYLTGFSYLNNNNKNKNKAKLLTLKILFNSYNYKTYNWRVIN